MTVRNSFAGLPAFLFGDGGLHNQLVCDVRTYVRAVDDDGRELLAPMLAWSPGPPAIGDTGDNSPGHMMGTTWLLQVCPDGSWVLYREERGRLEVMPFDDPPDYVTPTARHVSLCFDQAARVALAWEDQGIIKVRRWDAEQNQYIENVSFAGHDPVVVFDAQWAYQIPGSDVLLFYLSSDRQTVMCRVQRETYANEHELHQYDAPVILDRVAPLAYRYQLLLAGASGEPLDHALVSSLYPLATRAELRVAGEFHGGAYDLAAYEYQPTVAAALAGEFTAGALTLPVVKVEPLISVSVAGAFAAGALEDVVTKYEPQFGVQLTGEFISGELAAIGTRVERTLALGLAGEFVGGAYEPA